MSWLINSSTPSSLGLRIAGGEFRSGSASSVRLVAAQDVDAATELFAYNSDVEITLGATPFFKGTCRRIPKAADDSSEGISYLIQDAWAELEKTTYQEPWAAGSGSVLLPQVILGLSSAGVRISLAEQIAEVIAFAAASGIAIQCGTLPVGMDLWPSEATGMSCAEVIRTCLRYHPDWIPWLDHSTSPPTFQVTPRATAQAATLALTECASVLVTERAERVPDAVRIVFITADVIDGEIYRSGTIQKYPLDGPDSGPGVLTTVVELGGGQCAIAKQQIETRDLPIPGVSTRDQAKAWLKEKYPFIAAIANTHFGFVDWAAEVVTDPNPKPDPINAKAARLALRDMADAPHELVAGTVQEWMRKRVGQVSIKMTVIPSPLATLAERKLIASIPSQTYVTGTNAITKIYKGRPQWMTASEQAPAGIAEAYYKTILAGCMHEGSATFVAAADGDMTGWHGKVLNIGGGASGWADMKATIHAVSWDLESGEVALSFGPNPDYAVQDFVAYLRLLRQRPATWMSGAERTSNELGGGDEASGKGDHVGPPNGPQNATRPPAPGALPPLWVSIVPEEGATLEDPPTYSAVVEPGCVLERRRATEATNMIYWQPSNLLTTGLPTHFPAVIGEALYCDVFSSWPDGEVTAVSLNADADGLQTEEDPTYHVFHYKLGVFIDMGAGVVGFEPALAGSHIYHWPEGKGLDLRVVKFEEGASGWQPVTGEDVTHYWRRGWYIGTTAPGSTADHLQDVSNLVP